MTWKWCLGLLAYKKKKEKKNTFREHNYIVYSFLLEINLIQMYK